MYLQNYVHLSSAQANHEVEPHPFEKTVFKVNFKSIIEVDGFIRLKLEKSVELNLYLHDNKPYSEYKYMIVSSCLNHCRYLLLNPQNSHPSHSSPTDCMLVLLLA